MEKPEKVIPEKVIGYKFGPIKSTMNLVNCMTYSIGTKLPKKVNFSVSAKKPKNGLFEPF